jgi:hypothetical protein
VRALPWVQTPLDTVDKDYSADLVLIEDKQQLKKVAILK